MGKRTQTSSDNIKYLFKVLEGELSLSLESGAEDTLQDKRTK